VRTHKITPKEVDLWEEVLRTPEWWFYINDMGEIPNSNAYDIGLLTTARIRGKHRGSKGFSSPMSDTGVSAKRNMEAQKKVRGWISQPLVLNFGYKRSVLIDPKYPMGIILLEKDSLRIISWANYTLYGLKCLGLGRTTGGFTSVPAKGMKSLTTKPTNSTIEKHFPIGELINLIVSTAMSTELGEKND